MVFRAVVFKLLVWCGAEGYVSGLQDAEVVLRADNLTAFMCRLSCNLGASTSWNPHGLSSPVMGLLYLVPYVVWLKYNVTSWSMIWCSQCIEWITPTPITLLPCTLYSLYRVSQEECVRLREGVPYVKVYRYNPKHLCPKLNGCGDNCQRKVWSSGGSTHCTCQLTTLSMSLLECGVILRQFSSRSL